MSSGDKVKKADDVIVNVLGLGLKNLPILRK